MKSQKPGKNISNIEVLNVTPRGIWLHVQGVEHFLPYQDFPWFKKAKLSQIRDVQLLNNHYLHWNRLDIDLEIESLKNKDKYCLIYQPSYQEVLQQTAGILKRRTDSVRFVRKLRNEWK